MTQKEIIEPGKHKNQKLLDQYYRRHRVLESLLAGEIDPPVRYQIQLEETARIIKALQRDTEDIRMDIETELIVMVEEYAELVETMQKYPTTSTTAVGVAKGIVTKLNQILCR